MSDNRLTVIYTNIGRGHPFYLDGIVEEMKRLEPRRDLCNVTDVFALSTGLSGLAWRIARLLYFKGAEGGLLGEVYRRLRSSGDYNRPSLGLRLLGHDINAAFDFGPEKLLVAHPSLVGILSGHPGLIYQHGELVAPAESIVKGAATVIVPTEELAGPFMKAGYTADQIFVSNLCVEPDLTQQAEECLKSRIARYASEQPLTGGFFSSGAEPSAHVDLICRAAICVASGKGRAIIFAREGGRLDTEASRRFSEAGINLARCDSADADSAQCILVPFVDRADENRMTARFFRRLDYFVAPSHERVNWAVGLGLPMFILFPLIGPFSPLNAKLAVREMVASELRDAADADNFSNNLHLLRKSCRLIAMAENGWGRLRIDGFSRIAEKLSLALSGEHKS